MRTVIPIDVLRPFDPETARIMGLAFDTAWEKLLGAGGPLAASFNADATREALALRIVHMAQRGEHDLNRLRDDAVAFVQRRVTPRREFAAPNSESHSRP